MLSPSSACKVATTEDTKIVDFYNDSICKACKATVLANLDFMAEHSKTRMTKVNDHITTDSNRYTPLSRYSFFSTPLCASRYSFPYLFHSLLPNKHLLFMPAVIMHSLFQGMRRVLLLNASSSSSSRLRLHCLLLFALQPGDDRTKRENGDYSSGKKIPHTCEP